ncbi:hypothetical protein BC835DRAFT_1395513 [Cytidiella melzeri]|nr:hypothetical protein BC835DRAFT_1395513 [Cytidiella melzeri]
MSQLLWRWKRRRRLGQELWGYEISSVVTIWVLIIVLLKTRSHLFGQLLIQCGSGVIFELPPVGIYTPAVLVLVLVFFLNRSRFVAIHGNKFLWFEALSMATSNHLRIFEQRLPLWASRRAVRSILLAWPFQRRGPRQ